VVKMLTVQQADIISLLTDFKYLRYSHVKKYIAAKYNSSEEHLSKILKQLGFMGKVKTADGYVMLPGRKMDAAVIKAFDVVMDLTEGNADLIYLGTGVFTLMFSIRAPCEGVENGNKDVDASMYNNFGVVLVERYCENSICGRLRSIDRDLTVIFILSDMEQQKLLRIENKCYFAMRGEKGKYKFFKSYRKGIRTP